MAGTAFRARAASSACHEMLSPPTIHVAGTGDPRHVLVRNVLAERTVDARIELGQDHAAVAEKLAARLVGRVIEAVASIAGTGGPTKEGAGAFFVTTPQLRSLRAQQRPEHAGRGVTEPVQRRFDDRQGCQLLLVPDGQVQADDTSGAPAYDMCPPTEVRQQ
jgi:hypothetical protein